MNKQMAGVFGTAASVTSVPVAGGTTGRVCGRHAEAFWCRVVRAGAALAQLSRGVDVQEPDGEAAGAA